MGFFDKILKGLGFEDEEGETTVKKTKVKEEKKKKQHKVSATYNLNEFGEEATSNTITPEKEEQAKTEQTADFEVVNASNQDQIQMVVNKLKNGQRILLNIEKLSNEDIIRSLDFLTGAIFALNLKMQKIDEKIFLIQ